MSDLLALILLLIFLCLIFFFIAFVQSVQIYCMKKEFRKFMKFISKSNLDIKTKENLATQTLKSLENMEAF